MALTSPELSTPSEDSLWPSSRFQSSVVPEPAHSPRQSPRWSSRRSGKPPLLTKSSQPPRPDQTWMTSNVSLLWCTEREELTQSANLSVLPLRVLKSSRRLLPRSLRRSDSRDSLIMLNALFYQGLLCFKFEVASDLTLCCGHFIEPKSHLVRKALIVVVLSWESILYNSNFDVFRPFWLLEVLVPIAVFNILLKTAAAFSRAPTALGFISTSATPRSKSAS